MDQTMIRAINLNVNEYINDDIMRTTEFKQAIGYLCTWGNADKIDIRVDKDGDMTAHYYRYNTDPKEKEFRHYFTIGGILDKTTEQYSFHS